MGEALSPFLRNHKSINTSILKKDMTTNCSMTPLILVTFLIKSLPAGYHSII